MNEDSVQERDGRNANSFLASILRGFLPLVMYVVVAGCDARRENDWQENSRNAQQQIGFILRFGFQSYEMLYGRLPVATSTDPFGAPTMSWRGTIYCCTRSALNRETIWFDVPVNWELPWYAQENRLAAVSPCLLYSFERDQHGRPNSAPNVYSIVGDGTAFAESRPTGRLDLPNDTLLLIETKGDAVSWLEPIDIDIGDLHRYRKPVSHPLGQHVGFADGTVWCISLDAPTSELQKLCTIEGAAEFDRQEVLGRYRILERE